jgi:hypothetical protein
MKIFSVILFVLVCMFGSIAAHADRIHGESKDSEWNRAEVAIQAFVACITSPDLVWISEEHKICGVYAESRAELLSYLSCPLSKKLKYDFIVPGSGKSLFYRCDKQDGVVITIQGNEKGEYVSGIGLLLP